MKRNRKNERGVMLVFMMVLMVVVAALGGVVAVTFNWNVKVSDETARVEMLANALDAARAHVLAEAAADPKALDNGLSGECGKCLYKFYKLDAARGNTLEFPAKVTAEIPGRLEATATFKLKKAPDGRWRIADYAESFSRPAVRQD